ncbi:DUF4224 domain-containing protein [Noviherbaspirillum suwonense]|uniref:DUF4224 domain-containing protein n=1 Tax=Noviherbaspirillum suwonense TaxID=1224511 RepID=A0ABY1QJW6_9BURK|nr:DUF4224 domain-containing protein [Noviherbaspirillum suwonense]SMP71729.1 protein of unknown function [Noviherbaspirillum suwonense]
MNPYLTAGELAGLIGCRPNSFSCMRRWLTKNEWPFSVTITGFPSVSRAYHDSRMQGQLVPAGQAEYEPNMAAFS